MKHHSKLRSWLTAGCATTLVFICVYAAPTSLAQSSSTSSDTAKPKTKATSPNKSNHTKTSEKTSKAKNTSTNHAKTASATSAHTKRASVRKSKKKTARGQQKIESERAQAIQEALIREHYLTGDAAGTWNQASEEAMRKYQADHGWQSKTVPDSRALISLGLGPNHDHLLNPESAMTTGPAAPRAASLTSASQSLDTGSRVNTGQSPLSDPSPSATSDPDVSRPQ
jgi:FtsZ-interacting cell division protein ZipA